MKSYPASRGLAWFTGSLLLFRSQFARLLLIGLVLQFLMGASQAGIIGFLVLLAIPALTAGVMQAMFMAEHGYRPPLMTLFSAFSSAARVGRLFVLGVIMIAAAMLSAGAILAGGVEALDPEVLTRLEQGDLEALNLADPAMLERIILSLLAGVMISGTLVFFAVPLVWFLDRPAGSAILAGLAGMLRNWAPFLVLSILLSVLALPVGLVSLSLLAGVAAGTGGSMILTLLMLFMIVAFQMVVFASQYLSFRDVFGLGKAAETVAQDETQLLA